MQEDFPIQNFLHLKELSNILENHQTSLGMNPPIHTEGSGHEKKPTNTCHVVMNMVIMCHINSPITEWEGKSMISA